jgi:hypothetical protein
VVGGTTDDATRIGPLSLGEGSRSFPANTHPSNVHHAMNVPALKTLSVTTGMKAGFQSNTACVNNGSNGGVCRLCQGARRQGSPLMHVTRAAVADCAGALSRVKSHVPSSPKAKSNMSGFRLSHVKPDLHRQAHAHAFGWQRHQQERARAAICCRGCRAQLTGTAPSFWKTQKSHPRA